MSDIVLLDTSVYLNVLDVPGYNQERNKVLDEFETRINNNDRFLLPMATIWETGNHVARLPDGGIRRAYAEKLVRDVRNAINGDLPYKPTYFPEREVFRAWLSDFPDYAMRNKTAQKTAEGISLSDLSIIKEWEQARLLNSMSRVLIWSLDSDLAGYDTRVL